MSIEPSSSPPSEPRKSGEVDRVSNLGYAEFEARYLAPNKPVLITDALDHWAAVGKWTPKFFADNYRDMDIGIDGLRMGEFIELVEEGPDEDNGKLPYFRNVSINSVFPELVADISPLPVYLRPNWFDNPLIPRRISRNRTDLFIGGRGSSFPYLHWDNYHGYAFLFQIYGEKAYVFYPPEQTEYMYPEVREGRLSNVSTIDDIENPDLERFPLFAKATPTACVLRAGEMLFMPAGWWHTARMETASISVSSNTANAYNWSALMKDHWQQKKVANPSVALAGAAYLRVIRLLESAKDLMYRRRSLQNQAPVVEGRSSQAEAAS